ncbi:MAG: LapA family protein, partial [Candidatus Zixiibacteriota bacterium]
LYNSGPEQTVDVNLIWTERIDVPVITVVFWSFILGALVSWLLFISVYLKLSNQLREANRTIKGLVSEVTALRNRPIEETKDLLKKKND